MLFGMLHTGPKPLFVYSQCACAILLVWSILLQVLQL